MRFPGSNDTRLLLAGVVAFLALAAYLAVAFMNTHAPTVPASISPATVPTPSNPFAPFVPSNSKLIRLSHGARGRAAVRVIPIGVGNYGALVPTLVSQPPHGFRFVLGLSLKGARPGRIGIELDEFRSAGRSPTLIDATVPATARWRHFTFKRRIRGSWLGLGLFVYRVRQTNSAPRKWFAVRNLSVTRR